MTAFPEPYVDQTALSKRVAWRHKKAANMRNAAACWEPGAYATSWGGAYYLCGRTGEREVYHDGLVQKPITAEYQGQLATLPNSRPGNTTLTIAAGKGRLL